MSAVSADVMVSSRLLQAENAAYGLAAYLYSPEVGQHQAIIAYCAALSGSTVVFLCIAMSSSSQL